MLYYLFIDWPDLLSVEDITYGSYIKVFRAYKLLYIYLQDFYNNLEGEGLDSDLDSGNNNQDKARNNYPLADFKAFIH